MMSHAVKIRTACAMCLASLPLVIILCTEAAAVRTDELRALCYIRAYPEFFTAYRNGYLITPRGAKILFDDKRKKDCERLVLDVSVGDETFDPDDAFFWKYPACTAIPTVDMPPAGDPGRIRPLSIFSYMYGSTPAERRKRMRAIEWVSPPDGRPNTIMVTTVNGVDKALMRVVREINGLCPERKRLLFGVLYQVRGHSGYHERQVRGFPLRLSGHAYGIALDIYWDDEYFSGCHQGEPYRYRNNVPGFLVDIFERNGFIWGGRWHSYDAMHFEYRPELLQRRIQGSS